MNGDSQNFFLEQQRAVERMRESAARSRYAPPQKSPETQKKDSNTSNEKHTPKKNGDTLDSILTRLDIPFLNNLKTDRDTALILGLVLLLTAEKSDRLLLLALMYILL